MRTAFWIKFDHKGVAHFYDGGALRLNAEDPILRGAMPVEQAHQRLGIAEGVIHEVQEQLQRVSAGQQAMHQELSFIRSQIDTRSRIRLVEPKSLMPDGFGKKNGPSWRTSSYLARDFVGVVHAVLKRGDEECRDQEAADCCDESPT